MFAGMNLRIFFNLLLFLLCVCVRERGNSIGSNRRCFFAWPLCCYHLDMTCKCEVKEFDAAPRTFFWINVCKKNVQRHKRDR